MGTPAATGNWEGGCMDWWQAGSTIATSILAGLGMVGLAWRWMRREFDKIERRLERVDQQFDWVRQEFANVRQESGEEFVNVRQEFGKVRQEFGQEFANVRQEFGQVRQELGQGFANVRQEGSAAHDTIGARITRLQDAHDAGLRQVHDSLAADIGQLQEGQATLREGLGQVRGELRGVTQSVQTLRDDFRAHVLGGAG